LALAKVHQIIAADN